MLSQQQHNAVNELDGLMVALQTLSELLGECPQGYADTKHLAVTLNYLAERQKVVLDQLH